MSCDSRLCQLGRAPHAHCACGESMPKGAWRCSLCELEDCDPRTSRESPEVWDGTRPAPWSRRLTGLGAEESLRAAADMWRQR